MQIDEQEDEFLDKYLLLFQACSEEKQLWGQDQDERNGIASAAASGNSCLLKLQTEVKSRWWLCHRHYESRQGKHSSASQMLVSWTLLRVQWQTVLSWGIIYININLDSHSDEIQEKWNHFRVNHLSIRIWLHLSEHIRDHQQLKNDVCSFAKHCVFQCLCQYHEIIFSYKSHQKI